MTLASFYRGKKVFLTGHTGFKGAWMTRLLLALGAEVTGYSLPPPTTPSLFAQLGLAAHVETVTADIRDREKLAQSMAAARPDIVLHLAAQPLVRDSYARPAETFDVNVTGTVNVMEALRGTKTCRAAVMVTTDKCYENNNNGRRFVEDDKLGGKDPYSASKAAAELAVHSYRHSFFGADQACAVATARAGNVIGGGDWARDRLIPDVMRAAQAGTPVRIRAPQSTRPWQHVLEPVYGYLQLAESLYRSGADYAGGWNFGPRPADIQPVATVLSLLAADVAFHQETDTGLHPVEATALALDITKAERILGWHPRLDLAAAVGWTGRWYRAALDGADVAGMTAVQIEDYLALQANAEREIYAVV